MKITVFNIIDSKNAVNQDRGNQLFDAIKSHTFTDLTISFEGLDHVSTMFLNSSIGKLALLDPVNINQVQFIYPADKPLFEHKVQEVIENALLGEDYDELIDAAKLAL